jgi:DNA-binding winged helix-turn-helix (wHTH) protein/Tol biopolymer transport system component
VFGRPDTITTERREFADMTTNQAESARPALSGLVFMDRTLDLRREVLVYGSEELRLRPRTFGVLTHLLTNAGRVVTKQELMDVVWADVVVTEDSLVQCLIEIRRALGTAQDVVKTVRGRGYLVDCEVRRVQLALSEAVGEEPLQGVSPPDVQVRDESSPVPALAEVRTRWSAGAIAGLGAAAFLLAAGAFGWMGLARGTTGATGNDQRAPAVRFAIDPPPGQILGNGPGPANAAPNVETTTLAVSPDGSTVAMVAVDVSGRTRIWIRPLAALEAHALPATEGATSVFWSPDGRSIGFPADGKLKRLDFATGSAVALCDLPAHPGGVYGTWGADAIVYSAGTRILRVSTEGGKPEDAVRLEPDEDGAKWPWFLPDGRRFLYMARLRTREGRVKLASPGKAAITVLAAASSNVQWVDPGYLVFARDGALVAQRFDPDAGRMTGDLLPVASPVIYSRSTTRAAFAVSRSGVLVYQPRGDSSRLVWVDDSGSSGRVVSSGDLVGVRLSPDGGRALFSRATPAFGTYDLWYVDLARGAEWRLTSEPTSEIGGQWLPDGSGVVFSAERQGSPHLFSRRLNEDNDRELRPAGAFTVAHDVARDGVIAFKVVGEPRPRVVWGLGPDGGEPVSLMAPRFDVDDLRFAPHDELVAFVSSDSERSEVYVAPRSAPQQRVRVSTGGGRLPRWGRRGGSLFYLSNDGRVMSTTVRARPGLSVSQPRPVLPVSSSSAWVDYDVAADGRFLAIVPEVTASQQALTVLLNWLPVK